MLGCFQCNPHQSLAIYFQAGNRFKDINTEESGDAMILNVCVTDAPETAVFHLVCLEDKEMNSIIPRKMPDIVIMSHISVSEMFFLKRCLGGIVLMLYKYVNLRIHSKLLLCVSV